MQEMMLQGIFMERIGISYSHNDDALNRTNDALQTTLKTISSAIKTNTIRQKITGKIIEPVFTK